MSVLAASSAIYIAERPLAEAVPSRAGLLDRGRAWLRQRATSRILKELDPHMALDVGVEPACDPRPAGYVVDPRPLWGIGLIPQRMTPAPPAWDRSGDASRETLG